MFQQQGSFASQHRPHDVFHRCSDDRHVHFIQQILDLRRKRNRLFSPDLFADPAWDMLLELYLSDLTGKRLSVSSLCFASNVPPTTALRWIDKLAADGLIERSADPCDRRRTFVALSDDGRERMRRFGDYAQV